MTLSIITLVSYILLMIILLVGAIFLTRKYYFKLSEVNYGCIIIAFIILMCTLLSIGVSI